MTPLDSQQLESYIPVYDYVPEKWEEAREFLVEHLKKISNAVNIREIGFFLDEELLSGKQFIPTTAMSGPNSSTSEQFRTILRKTFLFGPVGVGISTVPHGIVVDANFTLIQQFASGTNAAAFTGGNIWDVSYDVNNFIINTTVAYDRVTGVMEFIQEI